MINAFIIVASIISVSLIYLGYLVLKKKKNNLTHVSFFFFSLFLALWLMCSFLENIFYVQYLSELFLRLDFLFGALGAFFAFVFLFNFPKRNTKFNKWISVFLIPTVFISILSFSELLFNNIIIGHNGVSFTEGPLFVVYTIVILAQILSGLINQIVQLYRLKGVARMQIKYVLISFFIIILLAIFNLLMQNNVPLYVFRLINFSPALLLVSIFFAIVKYRLLDIRYVLRLGTVFSLLFVLVVTIYSSLTYLISHIIGLSGVWLYVVPSLLIVFFFEKIKSFLANLSDNIFFQKSYNFSEISSKINNKIRLSNFNIKESLSAVDKIILEALKVSASSIYVINDKGFFTKVHGSEEIKLAEIEKDSTFLEYFEKYPNKILDKDELLASLEDNDDSNNFFKEIILEMEESNIFIITPIVFEKKIVGFYAFSEKNSKDYFKKEDLSLIKNCAWQIAWLINTNKIYESLKKVDKEKSELISIISHQFRSPLTSSRFNIELCLEPKTKKASMLESLKEAHKSI